MKKVRLLLSALAMVFAVAVAFAFNSKPTVDEAFFIVDKNTGVISSPYTQVSPTHWCEASALNCKRLYKTNPDGSIFIPLTPITSQAVSGNYHP